MTYGWNLRSEKGICLRPSHFSSSKNQRLRGKVEQLTRIEPWNNNVKCHSQQHRSHLPSAIHRHVYLSQVTVGDSELFGHPVRVSDMALMRRSVDLPAASQKFNRSMPQPKSRSKRAG